ncbi:MAG: PAS domain S-box protein [Ahrensia sp.]|nr:PAS domain S-box protein [Ahrensia sp.]
MAKSKSKKSDSTDQGETARVWIGFGASAGGLEALRGLARNLPDGQPAAYIVAQHMAPHHKSMLSEIIGRETGIEVKDVTDKLKPKVNTIYITPPNQNIIAKDGYLRLIDPSKEPTSPKPSVDIFLCSLAEAKGPDSVGIILSGTGSDGAKGIRAIRKHGGVTIAQDELTAKYSSMPLAAIETGCVDLVMSPEEIGTQIARVIEQPRDLSSLRAMPLNLDGISELIQLLHEHTKVNFRHYKAATVQRRVERRMAATNTDSLEDYVELARGSEKEIQFLFKDLLISVTSFFRDPAEFDALKPYISDIVRKKKGDRIRLWVPGSATGEEAYSLAMLFSEAMLELGATDNAKLQVFATDIDADAVEVARRGFYPHSALDQVPSDLIRKYFDDARSGYTVKKMLREKMVFSMHNVAQDPPFVKVDMISCRNLLIYFQSSLQTEVFSRFHYSLVPGGLLFLGKSEAVTASEALFKPAGSEKHIFYQRSSQERRAPREMIYQRPTLPTKASAYPASVAASDLREAEERLESLIGGLGRCAILIDSKLNIQKSYGDFQHYVGVSPGFVDTRITSLLREPFRQDIQAAVPGVIRHRKVSEGFTRASEANPKLREKVTIYPVENGREDETLALAVFTEWEDELLNAAVQEQLEDLEENAAVAALRRQVADLTNELTIAKTNLQQTVEELETSNEELQALNEELQSSNEELQSTNEELETSNEELQSTNEELSTVNEELQVNAQQLTVVNQSLSSILDNITIPLLVVDRNLNITNASGTAEAFFGIAPDLAMPHASRCRMRPGYPDLVESLHAALDSGEPMEWNIHRAPESATMKIIPHFSSSNDLVGAIVIVVDNTEELMRVRDELQLMFDTVPVGIMARDKEGRIIRANEIAASLLGSEVDDVKGAKFGDFFHKSVVKRLQSRDVATLESGEPRLGETQLYKLKGGRKFWSRTNEVPAKHPQKDEMAIYAVMQDITDQHEAEEARKRSELRLEQAVRSSKIGLWEEDFETGDVYWSERMMAIFGVKKPGRRRMMEFFDKAIVPEDRERVQKGREAHLKHREPFDQTYRIRRADGEQMWIRSHAQATWSDDGKPLRVVGAVADITEEREILNATRERKEQLELAADISGVGYWKVDLVNETVFWSEQVHQVHGTNSAEFTPDLETGVNFYHPDDVSTVRSSLDRAINNGEQFEFEARIIRRDGEQRNVGSLGAPDIEENGEVTAIFGVFRDITEEKRKESDLQNTLDELARSNEELNRFSYVCSHDMKEPVRMIEAMSMLLTDPDFDADDEKRRDILTRISTNTTRLRAIIDSLLAYSRIDAKIELEDADIGQVIGDILEGLSLVIKEQKATVEVGDMPKIKGAQVHFTQLFQNLIGNALKFSDKRKPVIKISAEKIAGGQQFLLEDNGPGIPEKSRRDIFNLFSRLQRRDEVEGTGLGLSIAQRIVMQYGGTIECVDSSLGGIGFLIFLPDRVTASD